MSQRDAVTWLDSAHYSLVENLTFYGQYTRRGDTILVWPVNHTVPVRLEFLGDQMEQMREQEDGQIKERITNLVIMPNIVDDDGLRFEPGQYVVHLDHGIGQFRTLAMRQIPKYASNVSVFAEPHKSGDVWMPFLIIDYAKGAELFVPPDAAHKLTHYIGGRAPVLSMLGSKRWATTKKKVEESIFKMSRELLVVAAQRELHQRPPLVLQAEWLNKVSTDFPYDPTDDQYKAIEAVISDLQAARPMDRLICGDVGFGKTEVAIRAAAAVVSAGKQVAILAPTTLLTQQHVATFQERLKSLPVTIKALSRFTPNDEEAQAVLDFSTGRVDVVIGTHRLLQPDIKPKDLGLLIIDEEQKFGVRHKEQLKELRAEVDILTLSATPIPRTLFLGLSGLRDISLIMTPPKKRLPIKTTIARHDDDMMKQAMDVELKRHGQVFVLHNDVMTIENRAREIRAMVPEATVAVAHGQMPEERLSAVMAKMIHSEIDVLVTSTIIESGLDMPNVNTLIVEKADHFGLSDLYQIRGRVGRSDRQAFAYFFHDIPELPLAARQRFTALLESETLGSGYTVALRDLEIRGGGNVLGKEQHGNMEAIGLSLYTKLLQLTVKKLQNQKLPEDVAV